MNKIEKIAAAAAVADEIANDVVNAVGADVRKEGRKVVIKAEGENPAISANEAAVLKAVYSSDFKAAIPEAPVYAYSIAFSVGPAVDPKSIPGIVASLNKKGMLNSEKVNGLTEVSLSDKGLEIAALLV